MMLSLFTFFTSATERRDERFIFYRGEIVGRQRLSDPLQRFIVMINTCPCQFITPLHLFNSNFSRLFNSSFELNQIGAFLLIALGTQEVWTSSQTSQMIRVGTDGKIMSADPEGSEMNSLNPSVKKIVLFRTRQSVVKLHQLPTHLSPANPGFDPCNTFVRS